MFVKLSDTQLFMLSAAAHREDRCLVASPTLKGGAAKKVAIKLVSAGFVEEIAAEPGAPTWRRDYKTGHAYALKLTPAGAKEIGIDDSAEPDNANSPRNVLENRNEVAIPSNLEAEQAPPAKPNEPLLARPSAPRAGSRLARVIDLLQRSHGATIEELIAVTGWLAHTTRAALTGLRKRGYAVTIDRSDDTRGSLYRIASDRTDEDDAPATRLGEGRANSETVRQKGQRRSKSPTHRAA